MLARIAIVAGVLAAVSAWAEKVAIVAVDGCDAPALANQVQSLRTEVAQSAGTNVSSLEETAQLFGGLARTSLSEISRRVTAVRGEFVDRSAQERAYKTLLGVLEDVRTVPPSEARWLDEREARTLLALLQLKAGNRRDAQETLAAIYRVEPEYSPDPRFYPPSLQELGGAVREQTERERNAALTVTTEPSSVPVFIAGRPMGLSPVTVQLPPRTYGVEVAFSHRRGMPRTVRLTPVGALVKLEREFEGSAFADGGPCLESGGDSARRAAALLQLGTRLGVNTVMGLRLEERFIVGTAFDVGKGQLTREARVRLVEGAMPAAALPRLARFLSTGEAVLPVEPTSGVLSSKPGAALARGHSWRTAGYVASGAALVAGVLTAVFLKRAANFEHAWQSSVVDVFPHLPYSGPAPASPSFTYVAGTPVGSWKRAAASQRSYAWVSGTAAVLSAAGAVAAFGLARQGSSVTVTPTVAGLAVSGSF